MFERGKTYLSGFLKNGFNPKRIPFTLEQPFVVPLNLPGGERRLKIGGKIDRVDKLPGGKIEIIDYKTGANIPTQKQIDHDLQLTFYTLAAMSEEIEKSDFKCSGHFFCKNSEYSLMCRADRG
jgi:RecB family exonuclease